MILKFLLQKLILSYFVALKMNLIVKMFLLLQETPKFHCLIENSIGNPISLVMQYFAPALQKCSCCNCL